MSTIWSSVHFSVCRSHQNEEVFGGNAQCWTRWVGWVRNYSSLLCTCVLEMQTTSRMQWCVFLTTGTNELFGGHILLSSVRKREQLGHFFSCWAILCVFIKPCPENRCCFIECCSLETTEQVIFFAGRKQTWRSHRENCKFCIAKRAENTHSPESTTTVFRRRQTSFLPKHWTTRIHLKHCSLIVNYENES